MQLGLNAQLVRQLLPTMRYVALDAPVEGRWGDWCVRARRIGDASENPMLLRFFQTPAPLDREALKPLRLDHTTQEFLFPQQLLTLPGNLVVIVRNFFEPVTNLNPHQQLQLSRKVERLLTFLKENDRCHGHLCLANLTPEFLFADAGWARLIGHGHEDSLAELGLQKPPATRLLESPDGAQRVPAAVQVGPARTLGNFDCDVLGVAFSPDSRTLAAVGMEPFVQLFDLESGTARPLSHLGKTLSEPCFSPDGRWLAARHYRGLHLWDLTDGSRRDWSYLVSPGRLGFSPQGHLVVQLGPDVEVLDPSEGLPRLDVEEVTLATYDVHPQWQLRAVGEHAGMTNYGGLWAAAQLYDFEDRLVWSQEVCRDKVPCMAFSPDGRWLACGSSGDDSTREFPVTMWELTIG